MSKITLKQDEISKRPYWYVDDEASVAVFSERLPEPAQFVLAKFQGTIRFLLEDGSLVVVNSQDVTEVCNYLDAQYCNQISMNTAAFYILSGHAQIELTCSQCDNGKSFHMFYDLPAKLQATERIINLCGEDAGNASLDEYHAICTEKIAITFYLNVFQVQDMFDTLQQLLKASNDGLYKYVNFIHDCASIFHDSFSGSGFQWHYSLWLTDSEIRSNFNQIVTERALFSRFYQLDWRDIIDPHRPQVNKFMESVDADYSYNWRALRDLPVEENQNPFVLARMKNISDAVEATYRREVSLCMQEIHIKVNDTQVQALTNLMLHKHSTTYGHLYYWYTREHLIKAAEASPSHFLALWPCGDMAKLLMPKGAKSFSQEVVDIIGENIAIEKLSGEYGISFRDD